MGIDFILRNAKKIIVFGLIISLLIALMTTFISFITTQVSAAITGLSVPYAAFFFPSALPTCLSIVISVKTAGTVYELGQQLIKWKVDTLA